MSVSGSGELDHIPFAVELPRIDFSPEGMAHRALIVVGDATGGVVNATFQLRAEFIYKFVAYSIRYVGGGGAFRWALRASYVWLTVAGPLSATGDWNVTGDSANPSVGGTIIRAEDYRDPPNIMMADLRQDVDISSSILMTASVNENLIQQTFDVWLIYWRREVLGRAGFLQAFRNA